MKRIRSKSVSLWQRGLRALSGVTVVALAIGSLFALGATVANAAPNAEVRIVPLANATTPHSQFSPFQYNISYSCSGSNSGTAGCANTVIRIPITLEARSGQVERLQDWTLTAQLPSPSAFTQSWESNGNTRTLVLTARNTIPAGVLESFALSVQPAYWVGDDVRFTVGGAQLTSTNGDPVTSNSHTATVTNIDLQNPVLTAESGYRMSASDATQVVSYSFDPKLTNILTGSGIQFVFGAGDIHSATTPNVTALYETIDLEFEIPSGGSLWVRNGQAQAAGTIPFPAITNSGGSGGTAASYELIQNGNTVTVRLPANKLPTDVIRFSVEYPDTMQGQQVCLPGSLAFTASNGDEHRDSASVCHSLNYNTLQSAAATKCGHGAVGAEGVMLAGMCSSSVMLPTGWTVSGAGSPSTGRYVLSMRNAHPGDRIVYEDFMPCFDTPGTPAVAESFSSEQLCTNPAVRIIGLELGAQPIAGPYQRFTSGVYYQLINNDGSIETSAIPLDEPFPSAPASGHWTGIRVLVEDAPVAGTVVATVHVEALPGVDREMILQNSFAADITRAATDIPQHIARSGTGIIRVKDIVSASARANLGHASGNDFATVSGSFTLGRLDPGVATPVQTLQLPAGFDLRNGNLSTYYVQFNGGGPRMPLADYYNVTIVPEDSAANTGPRLVMRPKPGTSAIPAGGAGWPIVSVQGQIERTTGQWNTNQTITAAISVDGDARVIDSCTSGATRVGADPADRDGDGVTATDGSCEWAQTSLLGIPSQAASANVTKSVRDAGDTTWTTGTEAVAVTSGDLEYLITWSNTGQPTLEDIVMYDLLPAIDDRGALEGTRNTARGSEFSPTYTGIIGALPQGMDVAYSASPNPCRPEVRSNNPGCVDDWTTDPADLGGIAEVTALRFTMDGSQVTGTNYSVMFGMEVPEEATAGEEAWNSVAFGSHLNGSLLPAVETAAVGAEVMHNVVVSKAASTSEQQNSEFAVGEELTYTIEAVNEYGANVEPVVLTDDLSEVLRHAELIGEVTASSGEVTYDGNTNVLSWTGELGPRDRVVITYTVRATSSSDGTLTNSVIGTANEGPTNCTTGVEEGCFANVLFYGVPGVSIDKVSTNVVEGDRVLSGSLVRWEYLVTNTGSEDLLITSVVDNRNVVVTCELQTVAVGATTTCSGQGSVSGDPEYSNIGTVTARGVDSLQTVQAFDTWSTPIEQLSTAVEVVKTAQEVAEGITVEPNQEITWDYTVTNTGTDTVSSIAVTDDRGVRVECPASVNIDPGDSVTCHGTGSVGYAATYTNVATVLATGAVTGLTASDTDDWTVAVRQQEVGLQIDKFAVGIAETDSVVKDTVVTWHYVVTNPGQEAVGQIAVVDDQGVEVSCGRTELAPGESMTCTGSGSVGSSESYTNLGSVTGVTALTARSVAAEDSWSVSVRDLVPSLSIVKGASNAVDGGSLLAGLQVNWNYTVTNTGEEDIMDLSVVDDQGVEVTCPVDDLAVGETVTCVGSARIGNVGSYTNVGTATGEGAVTGTSVEASDAWSTAVEEPSTTVLIEKESTEYENRSALPVNTEVTWEYTATNTGSEMLIDLAVTDDQGVLVECPVDQLAPGESVTCTGTGSVGDGENYTNLGTVTARGEVTGHEASAEDAWSTVLITPPAPGEDPLDPEWPQVPATSQPPAPSIALALTGGVGPALVGGVGLVTLLLGMALLLRKRHKLVG